MHMTIWGVLTNCFSRLAAWSQRSSTPHVSISTTSGLHAPAYARKHQLSRIQTPSSPTYHPCPSITLISSTGSPAPHPPPAALASHSARSQVTSSTTLSNPAAAAAAAAADPLAVLQTQNLPHQGPKPRDPSAERGGRHWVHGGRACCRQGFPGRTLG